MAKCCWAACSIPVDGTPRKRHRAFLATADVKGTDIAATNDLSLDIYPNPSSGLVYLAVHVTTAASITITASGRTAGACAFPSAVRAGPQEHRRRVSERRPLVRIMDGASARTERLVIQ